MWRNHMLVASLVVTSLLMTLQVQATQRESAQKLFWNYDLSNTNLCAQQSQKATAAMYVFMDGYLPGRLALNVGAQAKDDLAKQARTSWSQFHRAGTGLFMKVLNGLSSKQLKILSNQEIQQWNQKCIQQNCGLHLDEYWSDFERSQNADAKAFCHEIIQPLPAMFSTHMQDAESLKNISLAYLEAEKYLRTCDNIPDLKDSPDAMYKFTTGLAKNSVSFEYWESFKIYVSWAWRQSDYLDKVVPEFSREFKNLSIEDSVVMIPEGCYSVKKPECGTDDLSESHLRMIGDNKLLRLTGKQSAVDLREATVVHPSNWMNKQESIDPQTGQKQTILVDPRVDDKDKLKNYRSYLLNLMDSRLAAVDIADQSLTFLQTLFNQRTAPAIVYDVNRFRSAIGKDGDMQLELELMCAEVMALKDKDLSFLAKEIDPLRSVITNLNTLNFPGHAPEQLVNKALETLEYILPLCKEWDLSNFIAVKKYKSTSDQKMGVWFQRLSSSALDTSLVGLPVPAPKDDRPKRFLVSNGQPLCANEVQCVRRMMESMADLYSLSLYARSIFGDGPLRLNKQVTENFSNAVTCGRYDPWYESQRRKKKLLLDVASSLAQAILPVPIYLNIDPKKPELMSFKQRVEAGQIKFDPVFSDKKYSVTTILDLGPLTNTPCSISIGPGNTKSNPAGQMYAFSGISAGACSKERKSEVIHGQENSSELTTIKDEGFSFCGSCSLQFTAILKPTNYYDNIRYWGAGVRLFQGVMRYFKSKKSIDMPKSYLVNPEAAAETYRKYNGIPDECVWELNHGSRCMKNHCVSSVVRKTEEALGRKVLDAVLYNSEKSEGPQTSNEKQVWMKIEGCDGEVGATVYCDSEKDEAKNFSASRLQAFGNCKGIVK